MNILLFYSILIIYILPLLYQIEFVSFGIYLDINLIVLNKCYTLILSCQMKFLTRMNDFSSNSKYIFI